MLRNGIMTGLDVNRAPRRTGRIVRALAFSLLATGLFAGGGGGGCSGAGSNLLVTSQKNHALYQPTFSGAYATRGNDGSMDVVLTSRAEAQAGAAEAAAAVGATDVRQVLHVRVLWRPMKGTKADHPTATNATLNWYVFADGPRGTDVLEYSGAGFVTAEPAGDLTNLTVRNATLKPVTRPEGMRDPIGRSKLEGTITARNSGQRVEQVLSQVQTTLADAAHRNHVARQASSALPVEP